MDSINNACKLSNNAWLELQAFKTRQLNRREKLSRCKNVLADLSHIDCLSPGSSPSVTQTSGINTSQTNTSCIITSSQSDTTNVDPLKAPDSIETKRTDFNERVISSNSLAQQETDNSLFDKESGLSGHDVECLLILKLCDVALKLPIDSKSLQHFIKKIKGLEKTPQSLIANLLQKFAHQELITIEEPSLLVSNYNVDDNDIYVHVTSADHTKLIEFDKSFGSIEKIRALLLESKQPDEIGVDESDFSVPIQNVRYSNPLQKIRKFTSNRDGAAQHQDDELSNTRHRRDRSAGHSNDHGFKDRSCREDDVESLLSLSSTRERESKKLGEELLDLLSKPTYRERNLLETFRSADGYQVREFCPKGTKIECVRNNRGKGPCSKLHFKKIIANHTEESLGDCSFLNTCFHMDSCKYVHYEVDYDDSRSDRSMLNSLKRPKASRPDTDLHDHRKSMSSFIEDDPSVDLSTVGNSEISAKLDDPKHLELISRDYQARIDSINRKRFKSVLYPPQWIQCDLRYFDMSLLGKFSVVMADPPWDIHMELPYGTMSDDEMRKLNIPALQDEGVIFLWVTGRAMELGRECLALWGYERCDEIIWVKTNQLQRIIRTGRTGHWLNHGKEHCLVGVKGNPKDINRGLDCDVIVAEVRATSHKPDEIYGIIERLSPGTKKIELFGRPHNVQPNWITLGNQLNGVRLKDPNLISSVNNLNLPFQNSS